MLIDKNPVERYKSVLEKQRIYWDTFQLKMEALNETKMNMINVLFNVIFDLDLNFVCLEFF